jgi:type IV secretion system protein VirD4
MAADEEGGLQLQRHPGQPEEQISRPIEPERELAADADDDADAGADRQAMDRSRGLNAVARAHAMNVSSEQARADRGDDLLPSF